MASSKGSATGYSDFYKGNSSTPGAAYGDSTDDATKTVQPERNNMVAKRKAALQRRLKMLRAGS